MSLCATRCHRARLSCRRRATPQTPADVPGFPAPVPHRSSSEQPCTAKVRGSAREVCVARWYDPVTGQFLSVDPEFNATLDAYGYADENPLDGTDPSGLASTTTTKKTATGTTTTTKITTKTGTTTATTIKTATGTTTITMTTTTKGLETTVITVVPVQKTTTTKTPTGTTTTTTAPPSRPTAPPASVTPTPTSGTTVPSQPTTNTTSGFAAQSQSLGRMAYALGIAGGLEMAGGGAAVILGTAGSDSTLVVAAGFAGGTLMVVGGLVVATGCLVMLAPFASLSSVDPSGF